MNLSAPQHRCPQCHVRMSSQAATQWDALSGTFVLVQVNFVCPHCGSVYRWQQGQESLEEIFIAQPPGAVEPQMEVSGTQQTFSAETVEEGLQAGLREMLWRDVACGMPLCNAIAVLRPWFFRDLPQQYHAAMEAWLQEIACD